MGWEELGGLQQLQRTCSTINRHKREQEIMSTWKKKTANPSGWEFTGTSLEKTFPYKMFERPPDSVAGLMGKDLFLYKKKTGRWLFFQMHGSKHKVPRCMRNSKTRSNQIHKINFQQSTLETDIYEITWQITQKKLSSRCSVSWGKQRITKYWKKKKKIFKLELKNNNFEKFTTEVK